MTTDSAPLFNPCTLGRSQLAHRIVMAPMSRIRAGQHNLAPTSLTIEYYSQRASAGGLIITEAIHISPEATPIWNIYPAVRESGDMVPGIWTELQTQRWAAVVEAVHAKGGVISCQLLHTGRVAQPEIGDHPLIKGKDYPLPPVSASTIPIEPLNQADNHYNWDLPSEPPRALSTSEIERLIRDYVNAAQNAKSAGFDCIELHAAHGYLIDQFLCDGVNHRTDQYGGTIENRSRLLFEIVNSLVDVMGENRVGVRLSPFTNNVKTGQPKQSYFGVSASDPANQYDHAVMGLNAFPLAYLMLTEPRVGGLSLDPEEETAYVHPLANRRFRNLYDGLLIGAGGFTPQTAAHAIEDDVYDLIAFGRWFLANPDLPDRIKYGYPLNVYDRSTFYGGLEEGYVDYPTWDEVKNSFSLKYRLIDQDKIRNSLNSQAN